MFATHLESTADGSRLPLDRLQNTHGDRPLLVRYDLAAVRRAVRRDDLAGRPQDLWRCRELLPLREPSQRVTLGETATPLLDCPRLATQLGVAKLWIKDESRLPTGSFKARGMAVAVSMAKQLGARHLAAPSAGNAGGALAAYAARAGLPCTVLMPQDTPIVNRLEASWHGARVFLVDGLIHHCGAIVKEAVQRFGWFDLSTMKEPYRLEGKKTMGLELCDQLGWRLPDAIFYPTGGGTGLIGMDKAFAELRELGWLDASAHTRFFACQAEGCAPIVDAMRLGLERANQVVNAETLAAGLRVPKAFADLLILRALRESGGAAIAAKEQELLPAMRMAMASEGIALCPESAACLVAVRTALASGQLGPRAEIVVFNTGAAQKYVEAMQVELPHLRRDAVDWGTLAQG
jgi:threonine synthase